MRLVSVRAKNFRCYQDLNWRIPDSGLTLLDGVNRDTGRSNMTGKTTIIDSIFYCLYGYLPKWGGPKGGSADAVIRRGESKCLVQVRLEHTGKTIQITRERPSRLELIVNGAKLEGKSSDLDARIPELVGMSAGQFLLSVYISQDRQTSFFTMSDTERTKVLSVVSGLETLNRALDRAKEQKSAILSKITLHEGAINALQKQLESIPTERDAYLDQKSFLDSRIKEESEHLLVVTRTGSETIQFYESEASQKIQEIKQTSEAKEKETKEAIEGLKDELKQAQSAYDLIKSELASRPETASSIKLRDAQKVLFEAEKSEKARLHTVIENEALRRRIIDLTERAKATFSGPGVCGECGQALPESEGFSHMEKLLSEARALSEQMKPEPDQVDIESLRQQIVALHVQVASEKSDSEKQLIELQSKANTLNSEIRAKETVLRITRSENEAELKAIEEGLEKKKREVAELVKEAERSLSLAKQSVGSIDALIQRTKDQEASLTAALNKEKESLKFAASELDEILDLIDLFGPAGFRSVCFEGLIERLSDRAGEMLSVMTDHLYSTRIDQVGETSKGEQKTILRPVITKGGLEVPIDDLSGGARRMAMLAYDIALSEAVGDSSVLFLDEALDGLDSQGKSEAMRLLEEVAKTRAVFLVDHTSEVKSAVQSVITVEHESGISRIVEEDNSSEEESGFSSELGAS